VRQAAKNRRAAATHGDARLVACSFQMHFEWTGVLDEELARAFEVAEQYIGEDVRISIDFDSTVKVIAGGPGS
jgi:hypothetical protein